MRNWYLDHFIPPALGELTALQDLSITTKFSMFYPDRFGVGLIGPIPPPWPTHPTANSAFGEKLPDRSIPPELGQLTQLESLALGGNLLTGTLPPELGQLTQLETLVWGVTC